VCKWGYVSYPPFYFLNLPLPNKGEKSKVSFRVFPYSMNNFNYVEVSFYNINKFSSVVDLEIKIKQYKIFNKSNLDAALYDNNELVEVLSDETLIYDYIFPRYDFSDDYFIDYEISFIENPEIKKAEINIFITPVKFLFKENNLQYVIAIIFWEVENHTFSSSKTRDLQKERFKYYLKGFDDKYKTEGDDSIDESYYIEFYQKLNDEKYIEEEYNKFIQQNGSFDIYIYHNLPKKFRLGFFGFYLRIL